VLPLIQWTTVRLVVSENDWRRHDSEMEPQGGSVSPLRTRRPNRALGLSKTTLRSRVHVQTVGLNAATKKDRHRAGRGGLSLDIPFYRTCPISRLIVQVNAIPSFQCGREERRWEFPLGELSANLPESGPYSRKVAPRLC